MADEDPLRLNLDLKPLGQQKNFGRPLPPLPPTVNLIGVGKAIGRLFRRF